jgi:hypothetical protein
MWSMTSILTTPEIPPEFVVRTEAQKAAWDNGYRLERGIEGGWLHYGSTTAPGSVWIAGASRHGPWFLSIDHSGVIAEIGALPVAPVGGPGAATFIFASLAQLHAALDRVYKLAVSLPEAPLDRFQAKIKGLPQTTEAERLVIQRIGQDVFRDALMAYWGNRCPLTGITEPALLRASHIVPWAECTNAQRLGVHNGLLLSALWDAAFDRGLVSFADDGSVLARAALNEPARKALDIDSAPPLAGCATRIGPTWRCIGSGMGFRLTPVGGRSGIEAPSPRAQALERSKGASGHRKVLGSRP